MGKLAGAAIGALVLGAAVKGFTKGIGSEDISGQFFEFATGNPNITQSVFGTKIGMRQLFLPLPKIPFPGTRGFDITNLGQVRRGGGLMGLEAAHHMGLLNTNAALRDFVMQNDEPLDKNLKYSNSIPRVNGDIVFGSYNARFGG